MTDPTPAPRGYPIKLVRDRTPEIINTSGEPGDLFYAEVPAEVAEPWLRRKLIEEVGEYIIDPIVDELADVFAVVQALAETHGYTTESLRALAEDDKRGGFRKGQMMWGRHSEFDAPSPVEPLDREQSK